jgi:lysyl-tRNA synthetase class 2
MTTPTPPNTNPIPEPQDLHHLEAQRRANREAAAALNLAPYGVRTENILPAEQAKVFFDPKANDEWNANSKTPGYKDPRPVVRVAGRVVLHRDNGKLVWMNLRDQSGDIQVAVSQRDCPAPGFDFAKVTDLSDIVIARGPIMKTKTGEITIWAQELQPAAKSLVPPPAKHEGLQDVELRYRQRYVDLWANPETMRVFALRSRIVSQVRQFLAGRQFLEVETPMLQTLAGGAAARPFVTHMNALDIKLFMRIAPELYLKRLLVGGMPRVFEINRNFRNEGLDKQHNPEFTMLEAYEAFGDMTTVMELTESAIRDAAKMLAHDSDYRALFAKSTEEGGPGVRPDYDALRLPFGDHLIDYGSPFDRVRYEDLFERALGFAMTDSGKCREEAAKRHLFPAEALKKLDDVLIVNALFESAAEKSLDISRPTFITHYPAAISPLTRPNRENPAVADRADLFIGHMEIAPHYTELNDPDLQEAKFREQLGGLDADKAAEENTFRTMDDDFIRALKVGMPPAGGMGLGIDRLVMLLTNQRTIRDVVLFPLMRPE